MTFRFQKTTLTLVAALLAGQAMAYPAPTEAVQVRYQAQTMQMGMAVPGLSAVKTPKAQPMAEAPIHDMRPVRKTGPSAFGSDTPSEKRPNR